VKKILKKVFSFQGILLILLALLVFGLIAIYSTMTKPDGARDRFGIYRIFYQSPSSYHGPRGF